MFGENPYPNGQCVGGIDLFSSPDDAAVGIDTRHNNRFQMPSAPGFHNANPLLYGCSGGGQSRQVKGALYKFGPNGRSRSDGFKFFHSHTLIQDRLHFTPVGQDFRRQHKHQGPATADQCFSSRKNTGAFYQDLGRTGSHDPRQCPAHAYPINAQNVSKKYYNLL